MLSFKVSFIIVTLCSLLYLVSSKGTEAPVVLDASPVPVLGGNLLIYGLNLGNDSGLIKVGITDQQGAVECEEVKIIIPKALISCSLNAIGSGKEKHIVLSVNGISNQDKNAAFRRREPVLTNLTYDAANSLVAISGSNFGFDTSLISVTLDGVEQSVVSVNDSIITCSLDSKKRSLIETPSAQWVSVTVDEQTSSANLTVLSSVLVTESPVEGGIEAGTGSDDSSAGGLLKSKNAMLAGVIVLSFAGFTVFSLAIALFIARRRRQNHAAIDKALNAAHPANGNTGLPNGKFTDLKDLEEGSPKLHPNAILVGGRSLTSQSMEDVDLNNDEIYEKNPDVMSAASISSGSPVSSASTSPFSSPSSTPSSSAPPSPTLVCNRRRSVQYEQPLQQKLQQQRVKQLLQQKQQSQNEKVEEEDEDDVRIQMSRETPLPVSDDSDDAADYDSDMEAPSLVATRFPSPNVRGSSPLSLSGGIAELPTPASPAPERKDSSAVTRGMVRAPSSRLANSSHLASESKQGVFDSPKI